MIEFLADNVFDDVVPVASTEASGFEIGNALDGNRHTFARGTDTSDWSVYADMGSGASKEADTLAIARADLLVEAGATIVVQHTDDDPAGSPTWTNAFTPIALSSGDLLGPSGTDYWTTWTSADKRAWRLLITTLTAIPQLAGVTVGQRLQFTGSAGVDGAAVVGEIQYGKARALFGASVEMNLRWFTESEIEDFLGYVNDVSPNHPAELPLQTVGGAVWGTVPHWIYDATGRHFRKKDSPAAVLLNVVLLNGGEITGTALSNPNRVHAGAVPVRWRQVV